MESITYIVGSDTPPLDDGRSSVASVQRLAGRDAATATKAGSGDVGALSCPPHWWRIASPNGATCAATCKRCGATRTYSSSGEADDKWLSGRVSKQAKQFAGKAK